MLVVFLSGRLGFYVVLDCVNFDGYAFFVLFIRDTNCSNYCWPRESKSRVELETDSTVQNNAEWSTVGYSGYVRQTPIGMVGMPGWREHQSILFTFTIRRSSTFFKYTLITPSVLLAMLTLCLYWIPVQSGERFVLGL